MTHDALDSAFATLGLRRGASAPAIKRQYRSLVRKWHPDQFANDPQGMAEATLMLKAVNRAYRLIVEHHSPDSYNDAPTHQPSHEPTDFGGMLSQQQRDEIIEAIRHSESLLAMAFEDHVAGWRSRITSMAVVLIYMASGWKSGDSVRVLALSVLPLLCIWFPDTLGERVSDRITKPSTPWLVWFLGWVVLLVPALAFAIMWLRTA